MSTKLSPQSRMGDTISTRKTFRSGGASVMSFGTTKSSLSRFSKKSQCSATADAMLISQATDQAAQAAKAILDAGGSELTALKTAKAAALSALMPEATENEMAHGIGSSFLRRRKLKRQADVVASMALAKALVRSADGSSPAGDADTLMSAITEWDNETRSALMGLKILNEPTSAAETLSTEESSSASSVKSKGSTTEFISQQLKLIPTIGSASFSGRLRVKESTCSNQSDEDQVFDGISLQLSKSTLGTTPTTAAAKLPRPTPRPQKKPEQVQRQRKQQNNTRFQNLRKKESGCLGLSCSEEEMSVSSDVISVVPEETPAETMFMAFFNAITCTPILSQRPRRRQPEPIIEEEEDDDFDETITFDVDADDYDEKILALLDGSDDEEEEEADETNDKEEEKELEIEEDEEEDGDIADDEKPKSVASLEAEVVVPTSSPSGSRGEESHITAATNDEILLDLLASATQSSGLRPPGASPQAVLTSTPRNTIELNVPNASDEVDELSMSGASSSGESFDKQDEPYVQLLAPQKRTSRRLSRGGLFSPSSKSEGRTPKSFTSGLKMFRRRRWRNKGIAV